MSNPDKLSGGVVVQLVQACPVCDGQIRGNVERCPQCDAQRPGTGWIPVGTDVGAVLSDERVDDPNTNTSAPPPVVPVDAPVAARAPAAPVAAKPMTTTGVLLRFFGVFALSTALTAVLVVALGSLFLPPPRVSQPAAPLTVAVPAPSEPAPAPAPPIEEAPELLTEDPIVEGQTPVEPVAPVPAVVQPAVVQPPVVRPVQTAPAPVIAPEPTTEVAPEPAPEPILEPVPPQPTVPADVAALSGSYIGRADGKPISMELEFGSEQRLSATLRVAGRDGTEVHQVAGTYTMAPDGSADFSLTDRTDDGVVGYSGSISGAQASGIVTVDGRRRGRFSAGR